MDFSCGCARGTAHPRGAASRTPVDDSARLPGFLNQVLDLDSLLLIREVGGQLVLQDLGDVRPTDRASVGHHADDQVHVVLVAQSRCRPIGANIGARGRHVQIWVGDLLMGIRAAKSIPRLPVPDAPRH